MQRMAKEQESDTRPMIAHAVGEELILENVEPELLAYLGYANVKRPLSVYDLISPSIWMHHRMWVKTALRNGKLPDRLAHPLRR